MSDIRLITYGESHVLLKMEQRIDPTINGTIHRLSRFILDRFRGFVLSCTPSYCSLLISFDHSKVNAKALISMLNQVLQDTDLSRKPLDSKKYLLPVCYDLTFGIDLRSLSKTLSLSIEEIIRIHCTQTYLIYMKGFLPGFLYLGEADGRIAANRHDVPRKKVKQGSVGLAGRQTGIYPSNAPGGWQIIGSCPIPLIQWDSPELSIFNAGDQIKFKSIDISAHAAIEKEIKMGTFDFQSLSI